MQIIANLREFYYAHRYALSNYRELSEIETEIQDLGRKVANSEGAAYALKLLADMGFELSAHAKGSLASLKESVDDVIAVIDAAKAPNASLKRVRGMLVDGLEQSSAAGDEAVAALKEAREAIRRELNLEETQH